MTGSVKPHDMHATGSVKPHDMIALWLMRMLVHGTPWLCCAGIGVPCVPCAKACIVVVEHVKTRSVAVSYFLVCRLFLHNPTQHLL